MRELLQKILRPLATGSGLFRSLLVYYGMPWRRRALARFYRELIPADALVFDIGAHVGSRTRSLLANASHCVAVEPQPVFAELLQKMFAKNSRVSLVTDAVGREQGEARLHVSSRHPTVSTLSSDWLSRVAPTTGFEAVKWDKEVTVNVTTLDLLIARFGMPAFCKIDVEGMEAEILGGVSRPIPIVALEYIPATIDIGIACVDRLEQLGHYEFNLSPGETHAMQFAQWTDAKTLRNELRRIAEIGTQSGDLYARLRDGTSHNS